LASNDVRRRYGSITVLCAPTDPIINCDVAAVLVILCRRGEPDHAGPSWSCAFAASAMWPPLPAGHALHLCKSRLAGDPIIGAIRFASTSEGRHSRLHRQPDVNKRFLGRRD
jgi:hypothetical protein